MSSFYFYMTEPIHKEYLLVRHGETILNFKGRLQGDISAGSSLLVDGRQQAQVLAEQMRSEGLQVDLIITSKLLRAYQTAEIIQKCVLKPEDPEDHLSDHPNIEPVSLLQERGFGSAQGKSYEQLGIGGGEHRKCLQEVYVADRTATFKDPESLDSIDARLGQLVMHLSEAKAGRYVLVGHEMINSYLVNLLCNEGRVYHTQGNCRVHAFLLADNKLVKHHLDITKEFRFRLP